MTKTLISATVEDLVNAIKSGLNPIEPPEDESTPVQKHYVYGLQGMADLLGCSKSTAARIKRNGVLNPAIHQIGKIIIVDADLALDLMNVSKKQVRLRGGYKR